jgi:hypothetical protein
MPEGLCVMRTAESVVLTDWPPGPDGLRLWHPLNAVSAALELEYGIRAVALDRKRVLAAADLQRLRLEAEALGVSGQHSVDVPSP